MTFDTYMSEPSTRDLRGAWVEVSKSAIIQNITALKHHIYSQTRQDPLFLAVVKADAYGHGAVKVAELSLQAGANYLGVATVSEGIELRQAGIDAPILILSQPPIQTAPLILEHNFITTVTSAEFALSLGETADQFGSVAPYHLKIDTGMHRLGVPYTEAAELLGQISFHRGLELQGTFTHFATADLADPFIFTIQIGRFLESLDQIRATGLSPGIIHCANSAAALRYKQSIFDMVRIGIAMYGVHPGEVTQEIVKLTPAMQVKAKICDLRDISIGEGVGYGHSYQSDGQATIATLPIGYADGYTRDLAGQAEILLQGRRVKTAGAISMDLTTIAIDQRSSRLHEAMRPQISDVATLLGQDETDPSQYITSEEIAKWRGTITYEVLCDFGMRLDRVYTE